MNKKLIFVLAGLLGASALNGMDSDLLTLTEVKQDGITAYERESQKRAEAAQQRAYERERQAFRESPEYKEKEKEQKKRFDEMLLKASFQAGAWWAMHIEYLECKKRGDVEQAARIREKMHKFFR